MKVLLIEDETELAEILKDYLELQGFEVTLLHDGKPATVTILNHPWDMVLLDLMLPGMDGVQICREVRQCSSVPLIMLTAKVEEIDRLIGLEIGADDYICKPYSPREVVARIKAVLRRSNAGNTDPRTDSGLALDESMLRVCFDGRHAELTLVEWRIMHTLASKPNRIFSRDQIMNNAYNDQRVVNDRTIDSHINKLRKKLVSLVGHDPIRSVYGAGYKLELLD